MSSDAFRTEISVREIMNSPVITANTNDNIIKISKTLRNHNISSVIVVDDKEQPIGIVTMSDIINKVLALDKNPESVLAKDIMSYPIKYIDANETIQKAIKIFSSHKVSKLGVTYKGKIVGIISVSDVIRVIPELLDLLSEKAMIKSGIIPLPKTGGPIIGYCDYCGNWSDSLSEIDGKYYCPDCIVDLFGKE
jgi:CBS domain-containing protein